MSTKLQNLETILKEIEFPCKYDDAAITDSKGKRIINICGRTWLPKLPNLDASQDIFGEKLCEMINGLNPKTEEERSPLTIEFTFPGHAIPYEIVRYPKIWDASNYLACEAIVRDFIREHLEYKNAQNIDELMVVCEYSYEK